MAEGLTPLDVMLKVMRIYADGERWDEAAKVAAMAAPYVHPRLAAVDVTTRTKARPADYSDAELLAIVRAGSGDGTAGDGLPTWAKGTSAVKQ